KRHLPPPQQPPHRPPLGQVWLVPRHFPPQDNRATNKLPKDPVYVVLERSKGYWKT
ncbi:unnamed protein product, partial [Ectocarpus sp. 8 AP-2014]